MRANNTTTSKTVKISALVITHKFFPEKEKGARRRRRAPCKL